MCCWLKKIYYCVVLLGQFVYSVYSFIKTKRLFIKLMEIFSFLIKTTTMRTTNVAANCPDSLWLVEGVTSLPSITLLKMQSQVPIFSTKWFNMNQYSVVPILLGHYALKFCVWCPCVSFQKKYFVVKIFKTHWEWTVCSLCS